MFISVEVETPPTTQKLTKNMISATSNTSFKIGFVIQYMIALFVYSALRNLAKKI